MDEGAQRVGMLLREGTSSRRDRLRRNSHEFRIRDSRDACTDKRKADDENG